MEETFTKTRTRLQNNNKIAYVNRIELSYGTVRVWVFVIRLTNKTISKLTKLSNTQEDRCYPNFVTTHSCYYLNHDRSTIITEVIKLGMKS